MLLELRGIKKKYGNNVALKDFSFSFTPGIYGILGPNGAGKSTLINIITGNLSQSAGVIFLDGENIKSMGKRYYGRIGFMPQQQQMPVGFTLRRFLWYMGGLKGLDKYETESEIQSLVKKVNLESDLDKKLTVFSGGMKQRALLVQAMMGHPDILILDEPTAGLDPVERVRFRNLVSKVAFEKTVLLATHVVSDIQYVANEVIVLKKGCILESGTPWELCEGLKGKVFEAVVSEKEINEVEKDFKIADMVKDRDKIRIRIISERKPEEYEYTELKPTLEDVYLALCEPYMM